MIDRIEAYHPLYSLVEYRIEDLRKRRLNEREMNQSVLDWTKEEEKKEEEGEIWRIIYIIIHYYNSGSTCQ